MTNLSSLIYEFVHGAFPGGDEHLRIDASSMKQCGSGGVSGDGVWRVDVGAGRIIRLDRLQERVMFTGIIYADNGGCNPYAFICDSHWFEHHPSLLRCRDFSDGASEPMEMIFAGIVRFIPSMTFNLTYKDKVNGKIIGHGAGLLEFTDHMADLKSDATCSSALI